jgi:hypothetical protein
VAKEQGSGKAGSAGNHLQEYLPMLQGRDDAGNIVAAEKAAKSAGMGHSVTQKKQENWSSPQALHYSCARNMEKWQVRQENRRSFRLILGIPV